MDVWLRAETRPLRQRWLHPLVDWLVDAWALGDRPIRLLDFGCGDFQLAGLLPESVVVDGYDLAPDAREAARQVLQASARPGVIADAMDELAPGAYDAIVASSMLQYMDGSAGLSRQLAQFAGWLSPSAHGVVATDLVIDRRSVVGDAIDSWRFTQTQLGPLGAARELWAGARRGPRTLACYSEPEVTDAARAAGLTATALHPNLSPFRHRASYSFTPVSP